MFGMAPPPHIVKGLIIWGLGIGCVGFCLAGGLVYLLYKKMYSWFAITIIGVVAVGALVFILFLLM